MANIVWHSMDGCREFLRDVAAAHVARDRVMRRDVCQMCRAWPGHGPSLGGQKGQAAVRRDRTTEKVALAQPATGPQQQIQLGLRLDAFSNAVHAQAAAKCDHPSHQRQGFGIGLDLRDKAGINLDLIEGKGIQSAQTGESGAEIIQRKRVAEGFEFLGMDSYDCRIIAHALLGQLDLNSGRVPMRGAEHIPQLLKALARSNLCW